MAPGGYTRNHEKYTQAINHAMVAIPTGESWIRIDTNDPDIPNDVIALWEGPNNSYIRVRRVDTDPEVSKEVGNVETVTARVWNSDHQDWAVLETFEDVKRGDLFQRVDKETEQPLDESISIALENARLGPHGVHCVRCRDIVGLETQLPT
jgi:hypothetical protein